MAQTEPDDDETQRRESLVNPDPLFSADQLPGFRMQESRIERFHYRNGSIHNTVYEIWVKAPSPGSNRSTFVKLELYLLKNRTAALKAARDIYHATTEENQPLIIGRPRPGSYTGQTIGDYCWSSQVKITGEPRGAFNTSSAVFVVEKNNCFRILNTGLGDAGEGVFDRDTEKLAKQLVRRLKTWPRPQ